METTAIVAIALSVLRFSEKTWAGILLVLVLYYYGLAPLRRLYGFAPIRRYFDGWARGHLPDNPDQK
jgi:hypothetical protein